MIKKMLCVMFVFAAIGDHLKTGAPIGKMLMLAALSAGILFSAIEYLGRKETVAAELTGRFVFLISIISLMAVPWTMSQRIFISVVFMAVSSMIMYAVERVVQES